MITNNNFFNRKRTKITINIAAIINIFFLSIFTVVKVSLFPYKQLPLSNETLTPLIINPPIVEKPIMQTQE